METVKASILANKETGIFEKYHYRGVMYGTELLFYHQDALDFINDCEQSGLVIVGIDFYQKSGDNIVSMLNSADYSVISGTTDAVRKSVSAARKLLQNGFPDGAAWASFVVEE